MRRISCVLLFAMVIGGFDPWLLKVDAAKGEHTVATDEELLNPQGEDLELNIDDNPDVNDPMAQEEFRDPEEFCGEELTFEELEEMGVDYESHERNLLFSPSPYYAGGADKYDDLRYGIDVSKYQGTMNWQKAKNNGVSFAFIRAAYRATGTGVLYDDPYVYNYIQNAYDAGIDIGLYCFSQAITVDEAKEEANRLVAFANSRPGRIKLPLVMDYEYDANRTGRLAKANFSKDQATEIIKAFCKQVEDQGYEAMVYANLDTLKNKMNADQLVTAGYDIWLARYQYDGQAGGGFTTHEEVKAKVTSYDGAYENGHFEFWQCSSKGKGSAFGASSTYIDLNFGFFDNVSKVEVDVDATPTLGGKTYDLKLPYSWWYENVEVTVEGESVDKIMAPTLKAAGNPEDVKLELEMKTQKATQMKVKVINGYGEYLYELVYNLTYTGDRKYTATLAYINDYLFYMDSWPSGYDDYHAFIDGTKTYEVIYYEPWGKYIMALGRDMALDGNEHQVIIYKTDGSNRMLERTIFNLRFDNSAHGYNIDSPITDYFPLALTPPAGYDTASPQIWVDGVAYDAVKRDGKWIIPLGAPMKESEASRVVTVYSYNENGVPTGMTVYELTFNGDHHLTEMPEFKDALSYEGYNIRVSGSSGLRYRAAIKEEFKISLRTTGVNGYKLKEYGIVGISDNDYGANPLIIGGAKTTTAKAYYYVSSSKIKDIVFDKKNGLCYFSAYYPDMPSSAYKTSMVTRSYMKVAKGGKTYTIYSAPAKKNIYTVAQQIMAANNGAGQYPVGDARREFVESIISTADGL
ncbi:MAG: hypothetical protein HUJ70_12680 [Pseudobutyrivibrio sp.]|nr:hypothetical protein [Pseudobutyrivibrio sp.]